VLNVPALDSEDLLDLSLSRCLVVSKSYFQVDSKECKRRQAALRRAILMLFSSSDRNFGHERRLAKLTAILSKLMQTV
jgi:hypothetical protein